jgi:hypothetical protein
MLPVPADIFTEAPALNPLAAILKDRGNQG